MPTIYRDDGEYSVPVDVMNFTHTHLGRTTAYGRRIGAEGGFVVGTGKDGLSQSLTAIKDFENAGATHHELVQNMITNFNGYLVRIVDGFDVDQGPYLVDNISINVQAVDDDVVRLDINMTVRRIRENVD